MAIASAAGVGGPNHEGVRGLFEDTLSSFTGDVTSVSDVFELLRPDTPELPRYLLTLQAAADLAQSRGAGRPLQLCDLGGYFGVITAAISRLGYEAQLVDSYGPLLEQGQHSDLRAWWNANGVRVHDVDLQSPSLRLPFEDDSFDLITLLAVIEHFHNTPRLALQEIRRILRPDGLVIVDTPNAGALGLRVGFLLHGEGLWTPAADLYRSEVPFQGHTRCYSRRELISVLEWSGLQPVEVVMLDLDGARRSPTLRARVLYDFVYPVLRRRFRDLRGYVWIAARPNAD